MTDNDGSQAERREVGATPRSVVPDALSTENFSTRGHAGLPGATGIDLRVPHGRLIALVGPQESGAAAVIRFLRDEEETLGGRVSVLGVDVTSLAREDRRTFIDRHIGFVVQPASLLDYITVEENIRLMADPEPVLNVMRELQVLNLLKLMPIQLTSEHRWTLSLSRVLAREYDMTIAYVPDPLRHHWLRHLQRLADLQGRTGLVHVSAVDVEIDVDMAFHFHHGRLLARPPGSEGSDSQ